MTHGQVAAIDCIDYAIRLYGADVYFGFAQYCFWRTVATHCPHWFAQTPAYFLAGFPPSQGMCDA